MPSDFHDWVKAIVVFPNLSAVSAQDFPDWTDGIVQVTGSVSQTQDFPDWVKTTEVDTTVPIQAPNAGGSGGFTDFGNTVTVPSISGVVAGNLLVGVCVSWLAGVSAFTSPGWTQAEPVWTTDPNATVGLMTKTATGSEPASYTFTATTAGYSNPMMVVLFAYSGVTGLDGTPAFAFLNTSTANMDAASVTPTQSGDTLLVVYFGHGTNGGAVFSTPSGMFARSNSGHSGVNYVQGFDQALTSTAATGTIHSTTSDPGDWIALTILLH